MNATLKRVLVKAGKNAVGTVLGNIPAPVFWPSEFHFHNLQGLKHMFFLNLSLIAGQEMKAVVLPLLAKGYLWLVNWSQTNGNGAT